MTAYQWQNSASNEEMTGCDVIVEEDVWDSLAQVMIVGEIRNEFGVKLTSTEIATLENVGAMFDATQSKL